MESVGNYNRHIYSIGVKTKEQLWSKLKVYVDKGIIEKERIEELINILYNISQSSDGLMNRLDLFILPVVEPPYTIGVVFRIGDLASVGDIVFIQPGVKVNEAEILKAICGIM